MQTRELTKEKELILTTIQKARGIHVSPETLPDSRFFASQAAKANILLPHPVHMATTSVTMLLAKMAIRNGFFFYTLEKNSLGKFIAKQQVCVNRQNNGDKKEIELSTLNNNAYAYVILQTGDKLEFRFETFNHLVVAQGAENVVAAGTFYLKDGIIVLANDDTGAYYQYDTSLLEKTIASYTSAFTEMGLYNKEGTGLVRKLSFHRTPEDILQSEEKPDETPSSMSNTPTVTPMSKVRSVSSSATIASNLALTLTSPESEMRSLASPSSTNSSSSSLSSPTAEAGRALSSPISMFTSPSPEPRKLADENDVQKEKHRGLLASLALNTDT